MKRTGDPEAVIAVAAMRQLAKDGTSLRQARIENELSLADVAVAVGVTPSAVSRWETSQRSPRGDAGRRYAIFVAGLIRMGES